MRTFEVPQHFKSSLIAKVKAERKAEDPRKKDFSPSVLTYPNKTIFLARHFGFCYGVENAVEISYRTIKENPDKRIFLLSQMIHNPLVNEDLEGHGLRFIMDTHGKQLIPWEEIKKGDVVIIPAFGTTLEIKQLLLDKGIEIQQYNTTCPFVEKVWNMTKKLGAKQASIVVHGKAAHEETRATFSHSQQNAPTVVVLNMSETQLLAQYILGKKPKEEFYQDFEGRYSEGFDPEKHFDRLGVVNQTTMLASETHEIAQYLRGVMEEKFGEDSIKSHFEDTRDTLCYATNDNQQSTLELLNTNADIAIVVGGYNSSNTTHLVELLEEKFPTYFIASPNAFAQDGSITHYDYNRKAEVKTSGVLTSQQTKVIVTSGASCPDSVVEEVIERITKF